MKQSNSTFYPKLHLETTTNSPTGTPSGFADTKDMKIVAHLLSLVFHPLLVLTYMLLILLWVNPYMFGYSNPWEADTLILMVFLTSTMIPAIAVALMKALGWVKTMQMTDKYERIGPYIVTGILYLSLYLHIVKSNAFPSAFRVCTLGAIIALFCAFFVNNFSKISIHAVAMGGLVSITILIKLFFSAEYFEIQVFGEYLKIHAIYLVYVVVAVAGLVCTARLVLKQHMPRDIYSGFAIGFICQLISYRILL